MSGKFDMDAQTNANIQRSEYDIIWRIVSGCQTKLRRRQITDTVLLSLIALEILTLAFLILIRIFTSTYISMIFYALSLPMMVYLFINLRKIRVSEYMTAIYIDKELGLSERLSSAIYLKDNDRDNCMFFPLLIDTALALEGKAVPRVPKITRKKFVFFYVLLSGIVLISILLPVSRPDISKSLEQKSFFQEQKAKLIETAESIHRITDDPVVKRLFKLASELGDSSVSYEKAASVTDESLLQTIHDNNIVKQAKERIGSIKGLLTASQDMTNKTGESYKNFKVTAASRGGKGAERLKNDIEKFATEFKNERIYRILKDTVRYKPTEQDKIKRDIEEISNILDKSVEALDMAEARLQALSSALRKKSDYRPSSSSSFTTKGNLYPVIHEKGSPRIIGGSLDEIQKSALDKEKFSVGEWIKEFEMALRSPCWDPSYHDIILRYYKALKENN